MEEQMNLNMRRNVDWETLIHGKGLLLPENAYGQSPSQGC